MEPGILCFSHCGPKVFCFQLPELCPACRIPLANQNFLLPFRLPYPFVKASQCPCAVVIKPTHGDFLNDYKVSEELHMGVTTSKGKVVEFDRAGLHRDRSNDWDQCLVVYQAQGEPWVQAWDQVLDDITADKQAWAPNKYNEETFNCYTFVLAFIRCLRKSGVSEAAASRTKFCQQYVTPKTVTAVKYISLYRLLKDRGYLVYRNNKSVNVSTHLPAKKKDVLALCQN